MRRQITLLLAVILLAPATALADARLEGNAFDRHLAIAGYATGHAGSYRAAGVGGRARWEPFEWFGLEAYLEATLVDWPGALRHDYPNGFNAYVPIPVGRDLRLKPFLGFCDILSFIEPAEDGAPRADDVLFGAHTGFGAEWTKGKLWSLFADLQLNVYAGHDRTAQSWTGGVDEEFAVFWNLQLNLGMQLHFWPSAA
jgi:hypothetical protein